MVPRAALLVATLGGCNWVLGLEPPSRVDVDAAIDAPLGDWGVASPVSNHARAGVGEEDPFVSANELELYTALRDPLGATGVDLQVSTRTSRSSDWPAPLRVEALESLVDDATPRLSADGLTIFLSSTRPGGMMTDIWVAQRDLLEDPWQMPVLLPDAQVNSASHDRTLTPCAAGRRVFSSDRLDTIDLFEEIDGVATAIPIASDPVFTESTPFISLDCLTLYFSSNRLGSLDLYVATRAAVDQPFDEGVLVPGLSTPDHHESDPWISADGRHILFSVAPLADAGDTDVYEAFR